MKRTILLSALAAIFAVPAFANPEPVKVPVAFQRAYVPVGFDSNDHVQIVAEGTFANSCYRPAETVVKVDHEAKTIVLGPAAYQYGGLCLQVVLPFNRTIDIGILRAGTYEVVQSIDNSKLGVIKVAKASTENADDFLYAPISQAFFRQKGMKGEVLLAGEFMTDCLRLEDVKVSVQESTIVVQPIAKMEERNNCLRGRFPFSKMVNIELLPTGRYLLHVRSMNANAVNSLVDME